MQKEITPLERTSTWDILDFPQNAKPICCIWIFKIKFHADGSMSIFKEMLVSKVYNKAEGSNYFYTYSPMAKFTIVRSVISLASINSWFIHQLDVNNYFLHDELQKMFTCPSIITSRPPNQTKCVNSRNPYMAF